MAQCAQGLIVDVGIGVGEKRAVLTNGQAFVVVFDPLADAPARVGIDHFDLAILDDQRAVGVHGIGLARIDQLLGLQSPAKTVDAGFGDLDLRIHLVIRVAVGTEDHTVHRFAMHCCDGVLQRLFIRRQGAAAPGQLAACTGPDVAAGQQITLSDPCQGGAGVVGHLPHPAEQILAQGTRGFLHGIGRVGNCRSRAPVLRKFVFAQWPETRFPVVL
ncbi:hypothetical protein D3C78_1339010 [compost metagenome]